MNEEQGKFLEELYHANFKRMLLELYPILKDMPSAQVAIQEAARIACQKPEEMMSSPNPAGWLRKTAGLVAKNMAMCSGWRAAASSPQRKPLIWMI